MSDALTIAEALTMTEIVTTTQDHHQDHELTDLEPQDTRVSQSLPRADGGRDAWLTLTGCFLVEIGVWGFPFSFGVFQTYYLTHPPFSSQPGLTSIATTTISILLFGSPLTALTCQRFPWIRPPAAILGVILINIALISASFVHTSSALIVTLGILYAFGGLILYFPAMYLIDEWFVARKALAFAICWMGTYSGGAGIPFVLQWLLDTYGAQTTLRVWAVVFTTMTVPALFLMKNRLPTSRSSTHRPLDLSFLRQPPFWIYQIPNTIQSIAALLPSLWLPTYAASLSLPSYSGPLTIALLNLSVCGGFLLQGHLTDRYHVSIPILISTLGAMIAVFLFWGFATSQAMLYLFSVAWGFTGCAFAGTWVGCASDVRRRCANVDTGLVISFMCVGKGIGTVVCGPLGGVLLGAWGGAGGGSGASAMGGYAGRFGALITFTGVGVTLGGLACVARVLRVV